MDWLYRQGSQVALAPRHADAVEVLAQRHRVLARRAEQVANLGHRQRRARSPAARARAAASPLRRRRADRCRRRSAPASPRRRTRRTGPSGWPRCRRPGRRSCAGSGGWKPAVLVRRHDLVLELAQVGAELRLEVGPGDAPQVADQLLRARAAARPRRGPGRRRRRSRAATAPSAGRAPSSAGTARAAGPARAGCARPAPRPCRRAAAARRAGPMATLDQLALASCSCVDQRLGLVGRDAGAAHEVGRREAARSRRTRPPSGPARSASPVQSFSMRSSISRCRRRIFLATGCSTWPPPSVCVADELADDERLAPGRRRRLFEEELRQAPARPARRRRSRAARPCP